VVAIILLMRSCKSENSTVTGTPTSLSTDQQTVSVTEPDIKTIQTSSTKLSNDTTLKDQPQRDLSRNVTKIDQPSSVNPQDVKISGAQIVAETPKIDSSAGKEQDCNAAATEKLTEVLENLNIDVDEAIRLIKEKADLTATNFNNYS